MSAEFSLPLQPAEQEERGTLAGIDTMPRLLIATSICPAACPIAMYGFDHELNYQYTGTGLEGPFPQVNSDSKQNKLPARGIE